jgi:hypothetical protein
MVAPPLIGGSGYYPQGSLAYQFGLAWVLAGGLGVNFYSALPAPASASGVTYFVRALDGVNVGFWTSDGTAWLQDINFPTPSWGATPPSILYKGTTFTILVPYTFCLSNTSGVQTPPLYPLTTGDRGNIFFNTNMYGLFANFNFVYNGSYTLSLTPTGGVGNNYQLIVEDLNGTNYYFLPTSTTANPQTTAPDYLQLNQEYNSTSQLWSPIESIVFTSTLLPLYAEQVGAPIIYGEGNNLTTNTSTSAFTPIITDIALALGGAQDYRDFIEYAPTAEYRLTAFTSSQQECRAIDVQVFWKSRLTSTLVPLTLYNASSVSLKILFRKKGIRK